MTLAPSGFAETKQKATPTYTWFVSAKQNVFTQAVSGLNDEELDTFIMGRSFFTIPWVTAPSVTSARDGLGPLFNANTCASCHLDNLSAPVLNTNHQPTRALVFKLSQPSKHKEKNTHEMLIVDPVYGGQVAINGSKDVPFEATPTIIIKKRIVTYPDGQQTLIREFFPSLTNLNYGELAPDTKLSLRQAPTLLGLGLISQLSEQQILANADPDDADGDGISGRVNRVFNPLSQSIGIGRFGHKASQPSILTQTADAAANDMGLTNPLFPDELCSDRQTACKNAPRGRKTAFGDIDLPQHRLRSMAFFINHLKAPKTDFSRLTSEQKRGAALFKTIGCQSCHMASFTTPSGVTFQPFSDFLLHDMGERLADNRPEFLATAREWRTAPLWGTGAKVRNKRQFLHDGRANTPEQAILWHDGEAYISKRKFMALLHSERRALLTFLEAL